METDVRFIDLKKKLGWHQTPRKGNYSCYTCRHTYVHRMLSGYWTNGVGCSIETLAELIGDTPKVAFEHYGREWGQHYQDPLWNAIGEGASKQHEVDRRRSTPTDEKSKSTRQAKTQREATKSSQKSPRRQRT